MKNGRARLLSILQKGEAVLIQRRLHCPLLSYYVDPLPTCKTLGFRDSMHTSQTPLRTDYLKDVFYYKLRTLISFLSSAHRFRLVVRFFVVSNMINVYIFIFPVVYWQRITRNMLLVVLIKPVSVFFLCRVAIGSS